MRQGVHCRALLYEQQRKGKQQKWQELRPDFHGAFTLHHFFCCGNVVCSNLAGEASGALLDAIVCPCLVIAANPWPVFVNPA